MIEIEMLRRILICEPETGKLFWLERPPELFPRPISANSWNAKFAGKEAFTAISAGYHLGCILNKSYMAHIIVFALAHGHWPNGEIDHINGIGTDNRISNLRDVTHQENGQNIRLNTLNTSGYHGVHWSNTVKRWRAVIRVADEVKHLGQFVNKSDAITARKAAEIKYGFHPNHGRARA